MVKVTIACITYNHEKYIAQALDSFVRQKTDFSFEVLISDDCSIDKTQSIIRSYAQKYPDLIKPILREKNVGVWQNWIEMADKIKSEYVALCEGDDYWIDDKKLQKQFDFLELHKDFSVVFHPVKVEWENKEYNDSIFPEPYLRFDKTELTMHDLLKHNFIQTNSVMYRWRFYHENIYNFLPKNIIPIDYLIHLLHAEKGRIYCQDEIMAVYRKHDGGIWTGIGESVKWYEKYAIDHINFYITLEQFFRINCRDKIEFFSEQALIHFCQEHNTDNLNKFMTMHPELFAQVLKKINDRKSNKKAYRKLLFYKVLSYLSKKHKLKYQKLKLILDGREDIKKYTSK